MSTTRDRAIEAFNRLGNIHAVAREIGVAYSTAHKHLKRAGLLDGIKPGRPAHAADLDRRPAATVRVEANHASTRRLPRRGRVKRYIITSAQNNTPVHPLFWANLKAYAAGIGAELLVSQFTYDVASYSAGAVKPGKEKTREPLAYAPEVLPHAANGRVRLAPTLVFCGELNILPTAVNPLSGLGTYTGTDSCIVPHAKIAMESVPSAKGSHAKLMYTTGCCTLRNYIAKKEGQKAEFHHAYAALIVEVDSDGDWFVRQLNANDAGSFQDLTVSVSVETGADGEPVFDTDGNPRVIVDDAAPVEAVVWGDVHEAVLETDIAQACWGDDGSIIDALRPRYQFMHDVLDFRHRNHHETGNPHSMFRKWVRREESVRDEIRHCALFLDWSRRPGTETVVVASNHDEALMKWLRIADYKSDPINAVFFLECQLAVYRGIESGQGCNITEHALRGEGCPDDVVFLRRDKEFIVKGIDCGSHGDLGPNGFKASPQALRRTGRKRIVGHAHSAGIYDGLYVVGVTGALDQGYNRGDSSWSRTHAVVYSNGKRALITMRGEKWRA